VSYTVTSYGDAQDGVLNIYL